MEKCSVYAIGGEQDKVYRKIVSVSERVKMRGSCWSDEKENGVLKTKVGVRETVVVEGEIVVQV